MCVHVRVCMCVCPGGLTWACVSEADLGSFLSVLVITMAVRGTMLRLCPTRHCFLPGLTSDPGSWLSILGWRVTVPLTSWAPTHAVLQDRLHSLRPALAHSHHEMSEPPRRRHHQPGKIRVACLEMAAAFL